MDSGTNMDSDHGSTVDHGTEEPDSSSVEIIREEELQQGNTPKPSIRYKRARRIRYKTRAQRRSVVIIHEEEEEELQQGHNFMSRERAEEIIREEGLKLRMIELKLLIREDIFKLRMLQQEFRSQQRLRREKMQRENVI